MGLPTYQQLMLPVLHYLCQRLEETPISRLEDELARSLKLSVTDLAKILPSGQQSVFQNRLNWARAYLSKAGLIESTRRGYVRGNERAKALLAEVLKEIDLQFLARYPEFVAWRQGRPVQDQELVTEANESPEERIAANFELLNAELARELLERVRSFPPGFFERLIIDLLLRMGYGGGRLEMGRTLGRVGDGGVDGVIREDELGLDVVYVQAKRFGEEKGVPLSEVRDFVGGLEGHRASKGVFVTTSFFPATAYEFVTRLSKRVVLIDGPELANLMIRHRVGVRVKATYELKRIDEDYFVE